MHSVTEDTAVVNGTLLASGTISLTDVNSGEAAFSTTVTPAAGNLGVLVLAANGNYTYSVANSAAQYLGTSQTKLDIFTVTSLDGTSKQVSFTVNGVNDAPVANNDTLPEALEDTAIVYNASQLLGNDTDADTGVQLTIASVARGIGGNVSLSPDGAVTFTPDADFSGQANFSYTATDGALNSSPATVTVNVTGINDAPSGTNNTLSINEDTPRGFTATDFGFSDTNDTPANALAAVIISTLPSTGSLALNTVPVTAGQSIPAASIPGLVFTPASNGNGTGYASLNVMAVDDGGTAYGGQNTDQSANTITINVVAVNDAPGISGVPVAVQPVTVGVAADLADFTVTDIDSPTLVVTLTPTNGTLNGLTDADANTAGIQLTGSSASINAAIADATFTAAAPGAASIGIGVSDALAPVVTGIYSLSATAAPPPGPSVTLISTIQGAGDASPLVGQSVTVQARVTAWLPNLSLFYVQEEAADSDGNALTSEGVAVFYGTNPSPVNANSIGDTVRFTAVVTEFFGLTELTTLSNFSVVTDGTEANLDTAVQVKLPIATGTTLERYEGMLVEFSAASGNGLFVADTFTYGRFGEIIFHADAAPYTYTQLNQPSVTGNAAYNDFLARNSIILEDNLSTQNPSLATLQADGYPLQRGGADLGADNFIRVGDSTPSLTGVLGFGLYGSPGVGSYELQPTGVTNLTPAPRPAMPSATELLAGGIGAPEIKVSSFNVLNYFTQFSGNFTTTAGNSIAVRGANNSAEFVRQQTKIVEAIIGTGADVLGLTEIQNNGFADGSSAIDNLVDALNAKAGAGTYGYIRAPYSNGSAALPGAGSDAITVAIIYKPGVVQPLGNAAIPDTAVYTAYQSDSRVPVAQTFGYLGDSSKQFTLVVNHLKSKGSLSNNFAGDADTGDGQGNNNPTRLEAAVDLARWLATNPTSATDGDYLVVGDFNSYAMEDPVRFLTDATFNEAGVFGGYDIPTAAESLNGAYTFLGSPTDYSYVFDGLRGSLDYAFAHGLNTEITGITHWNINADEQISIDYNTEFNPTGLYSPNAFRSSDHDPVIIGLRLNSELGSPAPAPTPAPDGTPPTLTSSAPADNAVNIAPGANIVLTFSEAVKNGVGNIVLNAIDPGVSDVTIDVNSAQVSINGSVVTINPTADLQAGQAYAVQLAAGVIKDLAGNDFAGFVDNTTLNFTTAVVAPSPTVFINEIHYDNAGTDTLESISLAGPAGTDLSQYSIVRFNGGVATAAVAYTTPAVSTPLPATIDDEGNGFGEVFIRFAVDGLQNGTSDGIGLLFNGQVVQLLSYEGVFTVAPGQGAFSGLTSTDIGVAEAGTEALVSGQPLSLQLIGTGSVYNDFTWRGPTVVHSFGTINSGQTFVGAPAPAPAINQAPAGSDNTISLNEDAIRTFSASDFGFTDTAPLNTLAAVRISTLPVVGVLSYNGTALTPAQISAGYEVAMANLGMLSYTPTANANGIAYSSFTFQVRDNGGTANGGMDLDPSPNTLTFNIAPINDAPQNTVPAAQNTAFGIPLAIAGLSVSDIDAGNASLTVTLAVVSGTLNAGTVVGGATIATNGTSSITLSGSQAAVNLTLGANVSYTPAYGFAGSDTLTLTTLDNGHTGGAALMDIDTVTINVAVPTTPQTFTPNTGTTFGSSDASTALPIDARYILVGDDEANVLRVYDRAGGAAVKEIGYGSFLGIGNNELDLEGSTLIGNTAYFIGSHGNSKAGADQNNREFIFSATVSGTGSSTAVELHRPVCWPGNGAGELGQQQWPWQRGQFLRLCSQHGHGLARAQCRHRH